MKLMSPFVQLPLMFDAQRLAEEVGAIGESAWLPHPQGFAGNDYLALTSVLGDPKNDNFQGAMRPTRYLEQCPYLIDVLATLGASLGRTRLMRLLGHAEVTPHVDVHYYWRDRMRVHVPIVTQPTVRFMCGAQEVNMKEGECWIFDTWSKHRVINDAEKARIHLVVDTVGGEKFWEFAIRGRVPNNPTPNWTARTVTPFGASVAQLDFEKTNIPTVMSPWEVRDHATFLLQEMDSEQPAFSATSQAIWQFHHTWRSLWSTFGESKEGWPRYRRALDALVVSLKAARAETLQLRNAYGFAQAFNAAVVGVALADREQDDGAGEIRDGAGETRQASPATPANPPINPAMAAQDGSDAFFDRPVFIVNPPRSGSSALFETLVNAPNVYTVGGESHEIIEGMQALNIVSRQWSSNRLDASDASPEIVAELRARFASALRDRQGNRPSLHTRVRMLEKTPKNALRVPFLAAAFPEAHFIYLYRDPREVLSSMMEAWHSGRFRTYPGLPNWRSELPWSLLLTPGWSDLAALPLNERVAAQWATATTTLLNDLSALPEGRWSVARYDAFVRDPAAEVERICKAVEFDWDRPLGSEMPLSRHTVSKPRPDKWREREADIEAAMRKVADVAVRAERLAAR
jgi:hypothetical protein